MVALPLYLLHSSRKAAGSVLVAGAGAVAVIMWRLREARTRRLAEEDHHSAAGDGYRVLDVCGFGFPRAMDLGGDCIPDRCHGSCVAAAADHAAGTARAKPCG